MRLTRLLPAMLTLYALPPLRAANETPVAAAVPARLLTSARAANVSVQADGTSNSLPVNAPGITSISPIFAATGSQGVTLTVNGSSLFACAPGAAPCLGIIWQPATGISTFIPGQANTTGTQLTATIPAALLASAGSASVRVQTAGGTSKSATFVIAGNTSASSVSTGHLLFPNAGLNALQEFDPVSRTVVNTIPLPAPFSYSPDFVIATARIRQSDHSIITNAYLNNSSVIVALSSAGQLLGYFGQPILTVAQQLASDPLDNTQSTVLTGNPNQTIFGNGYIFAVNPYTDTLSVRAFFSGAFYTGLAVDSVSRFYAGETHDSTIMRYFADGVPDISSPFINVLQATGSGDIAAIAIDSHNQVYVAQPGSNRIAQFDTDGSFLSFLTMPSFNQSAAVYFNPIDGLLYVGDLNDDVLTILTTGGDLVAVVHMGGGSVGVPDLVAGAPAPAQGELEATQSGMTFQVPQGSVSPAPQSVVLVNSTSGAVSFTSNVSTVSGGSWLSVSGGSGSIPAGGASAPLTISVNPSGLEPGDYYGMIQVDAPAAPNSPEFVTVVLNVLSATANFGPSVTPMGLVFTSVGAVTPPPQFVQITNVLSRSTSFAVESPSASGPPWFTFSPTQGTIQPGQTLAVAVQPNAGLAAGIYPGTLTLTFPQDNVTRQIDLLLVIAAGASQSALIRDTPRQAATACTPTQLLLVFRQLGSGFQQPASWPADVGTVVTDDCASPIVSGTVTVNFSNGDPPINLSSNQDGSWSGSWAPISVITQSLMLTANALDTRGLRGATQISGNVLPNPNIPTLLAGETVSAASYSATAQPSPGEIVAIYGASLADTTMSAPPMLPLPTQLQGSFLLIGGQQMPLFYVSNDQVNAIIPYAVAGNVAQRAIARHGDRLSVPVRVKVAAAEPAVFTVDESGKGQGHIYVIPPGGGRQILADSSAPATAGDVLTIYCAGLGPVTVPTPVPPVQAGYAAPGLNCPAPLISCPAQTANPVSVMIGGQPATVLFAGLSPGLVDLYQINAQVPMSGVPKGNQIPFVITVAGVSSPPVTLAVK